MGGIDEEGSPKPWPRRGGQGVAKPEQVSAVGRERGELMTAAASEGLFPDEPRDGIQADLPRKAPPLEPCSPVYMRARAEAASWPRCRALSHWCREPATRPGGEGQNNEWQFPKPLKLLPHPVLISHSRAESGPSAGSLPPWRGSEWHCQGGTTVTEEDADPWMGAEGISQPPGRAWGHWAERQSACAEARGSEG